MATPIAHKGAVAGAKVIAATTLDLLQSPALLDEARTYFREEQTAEESYVPFIGADDPPAIEKNSEIMARFKEELRPFYYDPSRFDTYLEQLGIEWPQLPTSAAD
jgi:aminobenzoyl-glutamate utilization protein B